MFLFKNVIYWINFDAYLNVTRARPATSICVFNGMLNAEFTFINDSGNTNEYGVVRRQNFDLITNLEADH